MSNKYELNEKLGELQSVLARASRITHLGQPIRAADLYQAACDAIDAQIAVVENAIEEIKDNSEPWMLGP